MPTAYADPTGINSNSGWSGNHTDIDEGTRAPTTPATDNMYASTEGDSVDVEFGSLPSGTSSSFTAWTWNDSGVPEFELFIDGTGLGSKSSSDTGSGSWSGWTWNGAYDLDSVTVELRMVCGSDEDDEVEAVYLEIDYTAGGGGGTFVPATAALLLSAGSNVVLPPTSGAVP